MSNGDGSYNKEWCDGRHEKIDILIEKVFNRLNWFFVVVILTLGAAVANLIK